MDLFLIVILVESLLIFFGVYLIYGSLFKTPYYPSSTKLLDNFVKSNLIQLPESINLVDIGSGDGRIVRWGLRNGYTSTGIEFNPFLTLASRLMILGNKRGKIINGDFFKENYSIYNLAYLYIYSEFIDKLSNKLLSEMPKNSIIITNTFKFSNLEPDLIFDKLYIYTVK